MYWFKSKAVLAVCAFLFLSACKPDIKETGNNIKYFDLKGYLAKDILALTKAHNKVVKTVTHNKDTETKTLYIGNWGHELEQFVNADINRPAWKNSYSVTKDNDFLIYKSKEPDLHVVEMTVKMEQQKVKYVLIFTRTKNVLYTTTQKLTYFPDSLYIIEKDQKVRLLKNNYYKIEGKIVR